MRPAHCAGAPQVSKGQQSAFKNLKCPHRLMSTLQEGEGVDFKPSLCVQDGCIRILMPSDWCFNRERIREQQRKGETEDNHKRERVKRTANKQDRSELLKMWRDPGDLSTVYPGQWIKMSTKQNQVEGRSGDIMRKSTRLFPQLHSIRHKHSTTWEQRCPWNTRLDPSRKSSLNSTGRSFRSRQ